MHMLSHASNTIHRIGSPDNFSTDISELLHIENIKEAYRASNRVQYEDQMLWYNDRQTGIVYMVQILEDLALSRITTGRPSQNLAPVISLQIQVPERKQQVDQVVQWTRVARRARGITRLSLIEAATHFSIPDPLVLFHHYAVELWGQQMDDQVHGQRETRAKSTIIESYNSVVNYFTPFQPPVEIEKRLLRCTKDIGENQLLSHAIWVCESEDRDKDSFQGRKPI
ncbi:hypothetical protein HOY80DRAFT_997773 [Tuber brumale]|nr:hypothetical protein HOY80DRAFT_997773 [Tuber brumale]